MYVRIIDSAIQLFISWYIYVIIHWCNIVIELYHNFPIAILKKKDFIGDLSALIFH